MLTVPDVEWSSSNTAIAKVDSEGLVRGISKGTVTITGRATYNDTDNDTDNDIEFEQSIILQVLKKAIIIVPGLMGSRLVAGEKISDDILTGTDLWATSTDALLDGTYDEKQKAMTRISALEFNSDFQSVRTVDTVSDLDRTCTDNYYGVKSVYEELYRDLETNYNNLYDIRFFNYDWRYSNTVSAENLATFINVNNYDKVVLIAHSMGGLVASKFLANAGTAASTMGRKVEDCIFVASPLLGSPISAYILGSSDLSALQDFELSGFALFIYSCMAAFSGSYIQIKNLLKYLPSLYELLPSAFYFDTYDIDDNNNRYNWYLCSEDKLPYSTFQATNNELKSQSSHFSSTLIDQSIVF